jgi:hypothetical protein
VEETGDDEYRHPQTKMKKTRAELIVALSVLAAGAPQAIAIRNKSGLR